MEQTARPAQEITLPPRHPRVRQLIDLEISKMRQRDELAEIEKECEAAAEPFALDIERLETRLATIEDALRGVAVIREVLAGAEDNLRLEERREAARRAEEDARLSGLRRRLSDEAARISAMETEEADARRGVVERLDAVRDKFDVARTTSRGRAIERKIAKIEHQQRAIVSRNRGSESYLLEMAINVESERLGIAATVVRAAEAMQGSDFGKSLSKAVLDFRQDNKAEPSEFEVKLLVTKIIEGKVGPIGDVELWVRYNPRVSPPDIKIETRGISDAARERCMRSIMERNGAALALPEAAVGAEQLAEVAG